MTEPAASWTVPGALSRPAVGSGAIDAGMRGESSSEFLPGLVGQLARASHLAGQDSGCWEDVDTGGADDVEYDIDWLEQAVGELAVAFEGCLSVDDSRRRLVRACEAIRPLPKEGSEALRGVAE